MNERMDDYGSGLNRDSAGRGRMDDSASGLNRARVVRVMDREDEVVANLQFTQEDQAFLAQWGILA